MANINDIINTLNDEGEWIKITEESNANFRYIVSWNSSTVKTYDFKELLITLEWDLAQSKFEMT